MLRTLLSLKGNARACIWLEPLWGIPYNLYLPYAALYMAALGLSPAEIGMVASITLASEAVFSLISGVATDKLGRRLGTLIFDTLSWSVPEFIWMLSRDVNWFVAAALVNGAWRVTQNSWGLLLIEDSEPRMVVRLFSLTQFMGLAAAFVAPLSKFAVDAWGLVPTMRALYGITFASMTVKFIFNYTMTSETRIGRQRMAETRDTPVWKLLWELRGVFARIMRSPALLCALAISAVYQIVGKLNGTFWALLVTRRLGISEGNVALFSTLKSAVTFISILVIVPRVSGERFKRPLLASWCAFAASQALILLTEPGALAAPMIAVSVALEAVAVSILNPLTESLLFVTADERERARIMGLVYAVTILPVSLFPALGGYLANADLSWPFIMNLAMFAVGMALTLALARIKARQPGACEAPAGD